MENVEETAIEIVKKHFKILSGQDRIEYIKREYWELSISHSILTVEFISRNANSPLFWEHVKNHVIHMTPSKVFDR